MLLVIISCEKECFLIVISNRIIVVMNKKSRVGVGCVMMIVNILIFVIFVMSLLV